MASEQANRVSNVLVEDKDGQTNFGKLQWRIHLLNQVVYPEKQHVAKRTNHLME